LPGLRDARTSRILLVPLLLLALAYQLRHAWATLELMFAASRQSAVDLGIRDGSNEVAWVGDDAARAGLRPGDRLLGVAAQPYTGRGVLRRALATSAAGGALRVSVARDGDTVELKLPLLPLSRPPVYQLLLLELFTPLLCVALGFGVAFVRPRDPRAWLLLLLLLGFSEFATTRGVDPLRWETGIRTFGIGYHELLQGLWPLGMMLFGLYFPEPLEFERRRIPWLKWLIAAASAGYALLNATAEVLDAESYAAAAAPVSALRALGGWPIALNMAAVGVFFASISAKAGFTQAPDAKRRLRLLYWGASLGLTPMWFVYLFSLLSGRSFAQLSPWAAVPALLLLALFPLTLAYVIVVERALDVRVVIRQGLQYALAQRGVRVVQAIASVLVLFLVVTLAMDPGLRRPQRLQYVAYGVLFVVLAQRAAEKMRAAIDRRFFREAVNAEHVLSELSEEVRTIVETEKLLATVAERVSNALHVPRVATLLAQNGSFRIAHAFGYASAPEASLAADGRTAGRLGEAKDALGVYFDDAESWVNSDAGMERERPLLRALGSQLLLPLRLKDRLLGFLSLGPKQSEEPYSPSDVRLLRSVAGHTALALENSRLAAQVAAEVARAARMRREVEIAHEVQEQLFPQTYPKVAGLDLAGRCRPAAGVGGDYYDFVEVRGSATRLGIAIGDVSGKGIPAALLMAGLQASLRGQTLAGAGDLSELMDRVNRLVCDASPPNRYATFFYGEYEASTRTLRYVNAGHNAPMLFRGAGDCRQVLRLSEGGPVVGLLYPAPYEQHEIVLEPGDLLLGFTDGISECMSPSEEEWGEERLMAAVEKYRSLPASQIIEGVMREADAFASGAKQHDDMTLVAVRVL
jgi:sigma-B regulation protein RsbU (phosphoserine phosphatase)